MKNRSIHTFSYTALMVAVTLIVTHDASAALVGFEAESGTLGAEFDPAIADGAALGGAYITTETTGGGSSPSSADHVVTYSVTFGEAGTYDLYARIYIGPDGPGGGNDDSMHYADGFGAKGSATAGDWITVNGLPEAGVPNEQYVWVNLSEETGNFGETGVTFVVPGGSLTQTFQIGAREDGLRFDAIAFGTSTDTFTDSQLDASTASVTIPTPAALPSALGLLALLAMRCRR